MIIVKIPSKQDKYQQWGTRATKAFKEELTFRYNDFSLLFHKNNENYIAPYIQHVCGLKPSVRANHCDIWRPLKIHLPRKMNLYCASIFMPNRESAIQQIGWIKTTKSKIFILNSLRRCKC